MLSQSLLNIVQDDYLSPKSSFIWAQFVLTTPRHFGNWLQPKKVCPRCAPFFATRLTISLLHLGQVGAWMKLAILSIATSVAG